MVFTPFHHHEVDFFFIVRPLRTNLNTAENIYRSRTEMRSRTWFWLVVEDSQNQQRIGSEHVSCRVTPSSWRWDANKVNLRTACWFSQTQRTTAGFTRPTVSNSSAHHLNLISLKYYRKYSYFTKYLNSDFWFKTTEIKTFTANHSMSAESWNLLKKQKQNTR